MKPLLQLNQNNDYRSWVRELKQRYLQARLKASVEANRTLLEFYWSLGKDIAERQYTHTYGSAFYRTLSHDLQAEMQGDKDFSETNIRYMCRFYELYSQMLKNPPHLAEDLERQSRLPGKDDSISYRALDRPSIFAITF